MKRFGRFVSTVPAAFWLALLGVVFSLAVFLSGQFEEQTPFALFMAIGFLAVAVLTAARTLRLVAAIMAGLMAAMFALLAIGFAIDPGSATPGTAPTLIAIHTTAMVIAGTAAVSDVFAYLGMRHRVTGAVSPN